MSRIFKVIWNSQQWRGEERRRASFFQFFKGAQSWTLGLAKGLIHQRASCAGSSIRSDFVWRMQIFASISFSLSDWLTNSRASSYNKKKERSTQFFKGLIANFHGGKILACTFSFRLALLRPCALSLCTVNKRLRSHGRKSSEIPFS